MYFWSALIAFGAVAYSVNSASVWILLLVVVLSAVGLVLLLMPRFTPRAPRWAEQFVPPRYRRRTVPAAAVEQPQAAVEGGPQREPVPAGLHGATAIGDRSRFTHRGKIGSNH